MNEIRDLINKTDKFMLTAEQALNIKDKALNDAYDKRLVGDYGVGFNITEQQAVKILETARYFIGNLKNYLDEWLKKE